MAAAKHPAGRKSDKEWRDAIRMAVYELVDDPKSPKKIKAIRALARKLVTEAMDGNVIALREIGDRLDGKPAQALEHTGADGEDLNLAVTFVNAPKG